MLSVGEWMHYSNAAYVLKFCIVLNKVHIHDLLKESWFYLIFTMTTAAMITMMAMTSSAPTVAPIAMPMLPANITPI